MKRRSLLILLTLAWCGPLALAVAAPPTRSIEASPPVPAPAEEIVGPSQRVALILDCSSSMSGEKSRVLKEGAKLAAAVLDDSQSLVIVQFQSSADKKEFPLATGHDRLAAMRHIDALPITGGTDYLAALRATGLSKTLPAIFVSDGAHNGPTSDVLTYIRDQHSGPISTVAVQASPDAAELLRKMAVNTGGRFVTVERSEDLVRVILELTKQLGRYRTFKPDQDTVHCSNALGKVIALGFDATVEVSPLSNVNVPPFSHTAQLPGEHVHLVTADLSNRSDLTIRASQRRTPQGRLAAILRNDLARASMKLSTSEGAAPAGGTIDATTRFYDSTGKVIDPRDRDDLTSEFQVLDEAGQVISTVPAAPSDKEPELVATVPVPAKKGPIVVRNLTIDATSSIPFEAVEERTLLVQEPMLLTATPAILKIQTVPGRFQATLKLQTQNAVKTITYAAKLRDKAGSLRLIKSKSTDSGLELEFESLRPGDHRGEIVVQATASVPIKSLHVPFAITVVDPVQGLSIPRSRDVDVGTFLATSGRQKLSRLEFTSLDADPATYSVEATDLDSGTDVISMIADQQEISPIKGQPAVVQLTADIGNSPSGEYRGTLNVRRPGSAATDCWTTSLTLTVTEPLTVPKEIDLGKMEVGKTKQMKFTVKNGGTALRDLALDKPTINADGGGLIIEMPDKIPVLGASASREIELSVSVDPDTTGRGVHQGIIGVRRIRDQTLEIPVRLTIVDEGEGESLLLVAPAQISLSAKTGEIARCELRVKTTAKNVDEITAQAERFQDQAGTGAEVDVSLTWPRGNKLKSTNPVEIVCEIIAPDRPGVYTAQIRIAGRNSGTKRIPLKLQVK